MKTILVQMAEPQWTEDALHLACAMAQNTGAAVILLHLVPAQHYGWLGTSLGGEALSPEDSARAWEYKGIAAHYAVELEVLPMQYISQADALLEAAEETESEVVFARVAASAFALWDKFQLWNLRRKFAGRALYTLDHSAQSLILEGQLGQLTPANRSA